MTNIISKYFCVLFLCACSMPTSLLSQSLKRDHFGHIYLFSINEEFYSIDRSVDSLILIMHSQDLDAKVKNEYKKSVSRVLLKIDEIEYPVALQLTFELKLNINLLINARGRLIDVFLISNNYPEDYLDYWLTSIKKLLLTDFKYWEPPSSSPHNKYGVLIPFSITIKG